jgi:FkbM family methyltransferase
LRRLWAQNVEWLLSLLDDDVVVKDVATRLNRADALGSELLSTLVRQLHRKTAGRLVEQCTPVQELDYAQHRIELAISSPQISRRLGSVEKEPFTVQWIEQSIRPGDVFYDIGANVGPYSLIAAKATRNRARIFAFEPSPSSFRDLSRNVLLNGCGDSIVPMPLALWSDTRLLSFRLRSLSSGEARHRIGVERGRPSALTETVLGVRLDDLVERFAMPVPTHAKIDVDGYELEVLRGAEQTLARPDFRSLIIELDSSDTERNRTIKALLADAGFDSGRRHRYLPSRRHPHPEERPNAYWTFARQPQLAELAR